MKKERLLILFSKLPKKGNSKSRIAKIIGEDNAEKFCFACLDDLIGKVRTLKGFDFVVIPNTTEESNNFIERYMIPSISLNQLNISSENSKSEIFHNIFGYFLKSYEKVCLIPMDIPHIDKRIIEESFNHLDICDQVFGPEDNGGVYLIGLKEVFKSTFKDVRWSTKDSFNDLVSNSESYVGLKTFFDLNTLEDFFNLDFKMLAECPKLATFIKSLILEKIMEREVISK